MPTNLTTRSSRQTRSKTNVDFEATALEPTQTSQIASEASIDDLSLSIGQIIDEQTTIQGNPFVDLFDLLLKFRRRKNRTFKFNLQRLRR